MTTALTLIHAIDNSLQHALRLLILLHLHRLSPGNGFERRSFLSFRVHVLTGWRPSHANLLLFVAAVARLSSESKSKLLYRQSVHFGVKPTDTNHQRFCLLNRWGHSPHVTISLTRGCVCLLWICLAFRQVYVSHLQRVTGSSSSCTTHKSSVSTGFIQQSMPSLRILCYNGSLVTWTVVSLASAKFKLLIFSVSGFALSYTANMFILMILCDFCLSPAQFCYIIV
jgi:hypothetical protein